ncbi:putative baseplate assembly protein [Actinomadura kijaniata]
MPAIALRTSPHGVAMARMRAVLSAPGQPQSVRLLAQHGTEDPAIALLDAWALVCDVVSFYTERIAEEGFLATARHRRSLRELARTVGYELRPGVAAQTYLAFTVEDAPGAPATVLVPAGLPVQSIPGQDMLPQTFETAAELTAQAAWNAIPAVDALPQVLRARDKVIWLRGSGHGLNAGDGVLVVGAERAELAERPGGPQPGDADANRWDFRIVQAVSEQTIRSGGWTRLTITPGIGFAFGDDMIAHRDVQVFVLRRRAHLFGMTAPDVAMLQGRPEAEGVEWDKFEIDVEQRELELDGDHTSLQPRTWLVLEQNDNRRLYSIKTVYADGLKKYGLSGRITRVTVDTKLGLGEFHRRQALVHADARPLPAELRPRTEPVGGDELELAATEPPLPTGRLVLVTGETVGGAETNVEPAVVKACTVSGTTMTVKLTKPLRGSYAAATVRVLGNAVAASHGETINQVLGSGDSRTAFATYRLRRAPLTFLRTSTASGVTDTLEVRVDGVRWRAVESFTDANPDDRVYVLRTADNGEVAVEFGDGVHGARPPTGEENITARYRVGIGRDGEVAAGALALLTQRPLSIRDVSNPADTLDWAPPEEIDQARTNAPMHARTLGRAVSVGDHEDFARGFAGVGHARADLVWDGRRHILAVTVLGVDGRPVSDGLLADLRTALEAARDPVTTLALLPAQVIEYGARVRVAADPAYEPGAVHQAVADTLDRRLGPGWASFASAVTAAAVLVMVHDVPGVRACTMPELAPITHPTSQRLLLAQSARWLENGTLAPAEVLSLARDHLNIEEMP